METLQLALNRQQETDARLAQALEHQKNMFETRLADQERMYTDQLEAALRQAIDLARQTEQRAETPKPS